MTYQEFCNKRTEAWKDYLSETDVARWLWVAGNITTDVMEDACRIALDQLHRRVTKMVTEIDSWGDV
jgi:hypothetical protein